MRTEIRATRSGEFAPAYVNRAFDVTGHPLASASNIQEKDVRRRRLLKLPNTDLWHMSGHRAPLVLESLTMANAVAGSAAGVRVTFDDSLRDVCPRSHTVCFSRVRESKFCASHLPFDAAARQNITS